MRRGCAANFLGYRFRLFFKNVASKEGDFLELVVKTCQKGKFFRSCHYLVQFLSFRVYFSPIFSRIGDHLKAKVLERGKRNFFVGTAPYKFRSSTPTPRDVIFLALRSYRRSRFRAIQPPIKDLILF